MTTEKNNSAPPSKKKKTPVALRVREAIEPTVISLGFDLWDVELVKEGSETDLVVTIDAKSGVSLEDCEKVTRAIDPIIDELDPIATPYCLEVTSAGMVRTLKTPEHIRAFTGEEVEIGFFAPPEDGPLAGRRRAKVKLCGCDGGSVLFEADGIQFEVLYGDLSGIKTVFPDDAFNN